MKLLCVGALLLAGGWLYLRMRGRAQASSPAALAATSNSGQVGHFAPGRGAPDSVLLGIAPAPMRADPHPLTSGLGWNPTGTWAAPVQQV